MKPLTESLMKPWAFKQLGAVGRGQHHIEGNAFVVDGEWYIDARRPERPELAVERALARHPFALDGKDDIAGLQFGARRWPVAGNADHNDTVVDLGRIHAKPGARRPVDTAELA